MSHTTPIRVLYLSGYWLPSHHRKVELLADAPDIEIVNINGLGCGRSPGRHPSASGLRYYTLRVLPTAAISHPDIYRTFYWPPYFDLRRFRPDLIYCEHEQEGLLALQAALMRDLGARRASLILYSWQNILRPRRWYVQLVSKLTLAEAQHVFCASTEGVEVLRRQGYRGDASVIQQIGLDTRLFHPKPAQIVREQLELDGFVCGYIGRLVPEKGVDILLHAASRVQLPVQILIVGSGTEKDHLRNLAGQLGMAERCRFVDAVPQEALADYMNALDLLVLPSRTTLHWKEQFGRVLTEAMACRVAVAGSDSGAIPEVIGDAGRVFPEGDVAALTAILDELGGDSDLRRSLGEIGYQRVLTHYTVERLAEKTLAVWRALSEGAPGDKHFVL